MYYPLQIPYILNNNFKKHVEYKENIIDELSNFIICYWQMLPQDTEKVVIKNVILVDGCIDLVIDFEQRIIGFSGSCTTDFNFLIQSSGRFMGLRLMPGAFYQLTGRLPNEAMDSFLAISQVYDDFDSNSFFSFDFDEAQKYLIDFMKRKTMDLIPNSYTRLFNSFCIDIPPSVTKMCRTLNVSQSQCQRNFRKHFGLTPKTVLSILRFQKALLILTSANYKSDEVLEAVQYYDQSHYINDFKKNIGLTPHELISMYQA